MIIKLVSYIGQSLKHCAVVPFQVETITSGTTYVAGISVADAIYDGLYTLKSGFNRR